MILPPFLKSSLLEKVRRQVERAVDLSNFFRLGINLSFGILFCSLHITYFSNTYALLSLQERERTETTEAEATSEGYAEATLKIFCRTEL